MSDSREVTEVRTTNGKWILERKCVREWDGCDNYFHRKWSLIDCNTTVVYRSYSGVEKESKGMGDYPEYSGYLSVDFSDDGEWLDLNVHGPESRYARYRERLPDTGSEEERALSRLLLDPETPACDVTILQMVDVLARSNRSYPPDSPSTLHGLAIDRLVGIGGRVVPNLLAALETEGHPAVSFVVRALERLHVPEEEVSFRLIRYAGNDELRRRFASLLVPRRLMEILPGLMRDATGTLQVELAQDLSLCAGAEGYRDTVLRLLREMPACLHPILAKGLSHFVGEEGSIADAMMDLASRRPSLAVAFLERSGDGPGSLHLYRGFVPLVADALSDASSETRMIACLVLYRMGEEAAWAVPHLRNLASDRDGVVRRMAQNALRRIEQAIAEA